jgi:hypothetical protein
MSNAGQLTIPDDRSGFSRFEGPASSTGGDTTGTDGGDTKSLVPSDTDNDFKASAADGQQSVEQAEGGGEKGEERQAVVPDSEKGKKLERHPQGEPDEKEVSQVYMSGFGFGGDF